MKSTVILDKICERLATGMCGVFIGALIGYVFDNIIVKR